MSSEKIIVSTPIDYPKLVPDDWDRWWDIWNKYSQPLIKTGVSPNNQVGLHLGFDILIEPGFSPTYTANFLDLKSLYPQLYNQIVSLPVKLKCVRFLSSRGNFPAHIDNMWQSWSLRNMFHCDDPKPQWYYTDMENKNGSYLKLPEETNWWAYLDGAIKHGTFYREEYPKIILQVFSNPSETRNFVMKSIGKFPNYTISYDKPPNIHKREV